MSQYRYIVFVSFILLAIVIAGCIAPTNKSTSGTGSTSQNINNPGQNPGATDTGSDNTAGSAPVTGSLLITSTPFGADVYLNDTYVGNTSLTLNNLTPATVRLTLKLKGYARLNGTAIIVAGKTTPFSGTLTKAKADLQFTDVTETQTSPCYFNFQGTITHMGDLTAQGVLLTLTLTPATYDQKQGFVPATYSTTLGTIPPETPVPFGFSDIHVPCGGGYTASIGYTGIATDPFSSASNTAISGSVTV